MKKQTKILATISDMRCDVEFLTSLYNAGMNGVRLNTAHQTLEDTLKVVENVRKVSNKIPLVLDTKGPEIRTTKKTEDINVKAGETVIIEGDPTKESSRALVYVTYKDFAKDVPVGQRVLIDDGDLCLLVTEKKGNQLICKVENDGPVGSRKSVNVPGVSIKLPSLSEKDLSYLDFAVKYEIDFVAHSFVRHRQDVLDIKKILKAKGSKAQIIAKIENQEGVDNVDEIIDEADGVMVARGDMGIEIPAEQVPAVQKMLIRKCREKQKLVITATQMLHTMIKNPRPTRAEVSDIANAVYDGTDVVMLSGETANGAYPLEAVSIMAKIAKETEVHNPGMKPIAAKDGCVDPTSTVPHFLAEKAVEACTALPIKAIIADSWSGRTARFLASFRGNIPLYISTYDEKVMRALALSYGVTADLAPSSKDHSLFVKSTLERLTKEGSLKKEDQVLVMAGKYGEDTGASFIEVASVGNLLK